MNDLNVEEAERARLALVAARVRERRQWAEFQRIYDRCVAIADVTWGERLDAAQLAQDTIAQMMRDRTEFEGTVERAIPVPLFTPRDREQFIKEAAVTLFIEACKRGLTALPEVKDAPKEPEAGEAPGIEAASGVDEVSAEVAPA